ncbi:MAG: 30S ribosomal protein S2 [Candidatus Kerfeldbacteria bacterium]|nr:30S ribosomal protein S2 [Candidatus Kerfeldbacteria bacterium]
MSKTPTMLEMLKAGVHFGHRSSKWHPNMGPYIFTTKKNVHIINLEATEQKLKETLQVVQDLAANGKTILFVGTKNQASAVIEKYAKECGMPYITNRWLGGMLTNFKHVSTVARKLTKLKADRESGDLKKYTKKEQLEFDREIERLDSIVGGVENLMKLPDVVFIVDLQEEKTALREAKQLNLPIIAICDSNVDPKQVDYPIPGNDDAVKSIELLVKALAGAVLDGKQNPVVATVPAAPAVTPSV